MRRQHREDREVPTLPATDGLPLWAQILISLIVCVATLGVAFSGYFKKPSPEARGDTTTAAVISATIADMGAIRHLSDTVVQLNASVLALTTSVDESTHFNRNEIDVMREMCGRLRDLADEMERQSRDTRRWDK